MHPQFGVSDLLKALDCKILGKHPEPRGGHLKAPLVDNQLQAPFEVRKRDEPWFETQRAVLSAIRLLLSIYGKINTMAEEGPERENILGDIKEQSGISNTSQGLFTSKEEQ